MTTDGALSTATSTIDDTAIVDMTATANATLTVTTDTETMGKLVNIYASVALPTQAVSGVTEADKYTIDYYDLQLGIQIDIPRYPNPAAGDTVTF
ncbi:hypothetical protein [Enterobacter sp. 22452]|uniref:hypothetical protein n=1 Tax=Enterobacter TaxID=547 RepID=UPI003F84BB90